METLKIKVVDMPSRTFAQIESGYNGAWDRWRFNGSPSLPTYDSQWREIPKEYKLTCVVPEQKTNPRFEIMPEFSEIAEQAGIPLVLKYGDEGTVYTDYCWNIAEPYAKYAGLYQTVHDILPEHEEEAQTIITKRDILPDVYPVEFKYEYPSWYDYGVKRGFYSNGDVQHDETDKALFPSFALSFRPCKLSSQQMYKIVRKYIQDNINPQAAHITSDYDFCFTVKKKVRLSEPLEHLFEERTTSGKSYKNKKYRKEYITAREVEVFEMTNDKDKYKGYTVMPGIEAENLEHLKENLDSYLLGLIEEINTPLVDCPHCKGMGVISKE